MEFKGVIKAITEVQEGEGSNGAWAKRNIVLTEQKDDYPNELVLSMFKSGEHVEYVKDKFTYAIGDVVNVEYNTRANEYKDKWYGDNSIWKIEKVDGSDDRPTKAEADIEDDTSNDLPF